MTTWTQCQCSQGLHGHGVRKVTNYADTDTFRKLWRLLTYFKGTIKWKKVLGCVYKPNSNNLKRWKPLYLKKKFACLRSRWLCGHNFWTLRSNIFVKNEKSLQSHFCLFIWGPVWLKRFDLGPIWRGKNGFGNFFVFVKIFNCKVWKSRVRVVFQFFL